MDKILKIILSGVVAGFILFFVASISYNFTKEITDPSLKYIFKKSIHMQWFYKLLIINAGTGIIMAIFYALMRSGLPGNDFIKGATWGMVVWIFMINQPLITAIVIGDFAPNLLLSWLAQGFASYVAAGASIGLIYKD